MADRLSQLQDAVNQLAQHLCDSVGVLQQSAPLSFFDDFDNSDRARPNQNANGDLENNLNVFATLITRTAQDIDYIITSLPDIRVSQQEQENAIEKLQEENLQAREQLIAAIARAENILSKIKQINNQVTAAHLTVDKRVKCDANHELG